MNNSDSRMNLELEFEVTVAVPVTKVLTVIYNDIAITNLNCKCILDYD